MFRRCQKRALSVLRQFLDEIRRAFADHHAGEIGIGVRDRRHDRRVADPEIIHAVYAQVLVDYGHTVGRRSHFAGADAVKITGVSGAGKLGPIFIRAR